MKSRVDGKWPKSFSSGQRRKFTRSLLAHTQQHFSCHRRSNVMALERKSAIAPRGACRKLSCFAIFQNFVQGYGEFAGAAIELSRQKVVLLFQDVIFIGNVQRRQHRQPQ
jgi:hypothetical protein